MDVPPTAPLSDPLISQHEQVQRDMVLLDQVCEKFPDKNRSQDINWNDIYCFNMSPDEMSARFELLLRNIPKEKDYKTLVSEAKIAFCNAKIREVLLLGLESKWKVPKSGSTLSLYSPLNTILNATIERK